MIYPEKLKPGDKIAIISPATTVRQEYVERASDMIREAGLVSVVMPHANGPACGSYASSEEGRVSDLRDALRDRSVKAILCARGGYGCVHLLPRFTPEEIRANAKWLIGFSDVSALHALWHKAGVASIHGPMAKHMAEKGVCDPCVRWLLTLLTESPDMRYVFPGSPYNREGKAEGMLLGGNLAVLNGLAATPYDLLTPHIGDGVILFIEDISEAIYAVERMLIRLSLSGTLHRLRGLIVGQFTEYRGDRNHSTMEEMIDSLLRRSGIQDMPVAFGFPVGHVDENYPLVEGAEVRLTVTSEEVRLETIV
ncbi:MAG: LD-carboxypeptidase [Muribaculaceae bacterium]|nr:LD-carboxypeptidase [Muribaculaceae bacterium]